MAWYWPAGDGQRGSKLSPEASHQQSYKLAFFLKVKIEKDDVQQKK